ncbi:30S ribosomal protein S20 [Pedobacter sp.]|nr:30S ribosomal protein S20 [Candidatus Saccharibacteria bacterium]
MPIIKSAIKRMRQTAKRRARNISVKRDLKGAVKAFMLAPTAEGYQAAQSEVDTAVKKNILKKNTAARRKAQLSKIAKDAGVTFGATKKTDTKPATKVAAPAVKVVAKKPAVKAAPKAAAKVAAKPVAKKAVAKKPAAKATPKKATK